MSWQEELKRLLDIPPEAKIVTKPYYRTIPKRNGKTYKALTVQYVYQGRRRYKHVKKDKEKIIKDALSGEEMVYEFAASKLREIKDIIDKLADDKTRRNLLPLMKEIDRLLMKISTRIF